MSFSQTAVVKAAEGLAQIAYIRFRSQMIPNDGAHKVMICGLLLGRQSLSDRTIQKRRAPGQADHSLEESIEKLRDFIRDADDFVRCLAIEFEIKLGFRLAIIPLGKFFEFAPPQWPLRKSGEFDDDANARRLTGDSAFLRDCPGQSDSATRYEASPALILAREDEYRVAFDDMLAAIHRLLRGKNERFRSRIANLGFNSERHDFARSD
jgi:hypothetical protein